MFFPSIAPPEVLTYDHGERSLLIRRAQVDDVTELVESVKVSLPELHAFMPWSHFPENVTISAQTERLIDLVKKWDDHADYVFHIYLPSSDGEHQFAGCIGLHPRCLHNRGLEIGYWIQSDLAGRGVCTLATQMLVLATFQTMDLLRVQIGCDANNLASKRVIEKVGFVYEGLLRNHSHGEAPAHIIDQGWRGTGNIVNYGLIPEDLESLGWVNTISKHLTFTSINQA